MGVWPRLLVFTLCLLPAIALTAAVIGDSLGPDPAEALMHETGEWAARLLIATLLVTPLRVYTAWRWLLPLRRMLGLYCFFYGSVHLMLFSHFYLGWAGDRLLEELIERPYITVGFTAWLFMLPLALTSNRVMMRKLRRNWQRLHYLVYPAAVLVSLHYLWQARSDIGEALVYCAAFGLLLGWRLIHSRKKQRPAGNSKLLDLGAGQSYN
jgi:sulfoxide reductase heme-binding subunit YedZ